MSARDLESEALAKATPVPLSEVIGGSVAMGLERIIFLFEAIRVLDDSDEVIAADALLVVHLASMGKELADHVRRAQDHVARHAEREILEAEEARVQQ